MPQTALGAPAVTPPAVDPNVVARARLATSATRHGGNQVFDNWRDTPPYPDPSAYTLVPTSPITRATIRPGNQNSSQVRGPGYRRVDLTVAKAFAVSGHTRFQVRFES